MFTLFKYIIFAGVFVFIIIFGFILYFKNEKVEYTPTEQLSEYRVSSNMVGTFEKKDTLNILKLHGSYDEMGQQYGALAYNQLHEIYQDIVPEYFDGIHRKALISDVLRLYYYIKLDDREKELLSGIAKTSGLNQRQLLSIEMLPMLITLYSGFDGDKLNKTDTSGSGFCSFLSVWGNLSKTKTMLLARNLDLSTAVTKLDNYYSLVAYNPTNDGNSVASFGFIGFIPGFTWINNKGLFSEYNDGRRSVPGFNFSGYIGLNTAFYGMLDANNSEEFIDYIRNHPAFVSNFTAIVDKNNSRAIEHAVKEEPEILNGQLEFANFFTNLYRTDFKDAKITMSNCIEKVKDTPSYACVRYHHIEAFLKQNHSIGVNELKSLFSTSLDNGGVYQTGSSNLYPVAEVTNYTLIGDLSSGKFIYSNHKDKNVWLDLDINSLFVKN
ncbi:MAG: C45 family autoproteolytic acyltransferase/hydrolase [Burkholderiales bacterium]|nr:C45 family autoproteolytic acyltransferase/hydrolase [Burkholderiales bacterium]